MAKNNDKGTLLEDIVASFHSDDNCKVESRVRIKKREIDVLLKLNPLGYKEILIPIECKNQSKKVGSSQINAFSGKLVEIGLATQNSIFVSINGYTSGAQESAKKVGMKLLTVQGLFEDRLSKLIYNAIQSTIYILPIFNKYKVTTSIQNTSNNEHLLFFDKNKNYQASIADVIFNMWKNNEIPLTLGRHNLRMKVPDDWFNLYEDELHMCFPIDVEILLVGYVVSYYGNANHLILIDDETKTIEKNKINMNFEDFKRTTIKTIDSESELEDFLSHRNEIYKLDIQKIKLPKVRFQNLFYPISKKVNEEFQKFYSISNRSELEVEEFILHIQDLEKNILSVWDE